MQDFQTYRTLLAHEESEAESKHMQDVLLLLNNLAQREEATVKAILDRLYEVGAVRLINQNVSVKVLRGPLKSIARLSKPVFRLVAWRWFAKHCPRLITCWLFDQVKFSPHPLPMGQDESALIESALIDVVPVPDALPPLLEKQAAEINVLRDRVGWLTAIVVLLLAVLGFSILY
jgi:hypothetical protein